MKEPKPKKLSYELIERESEIGAPMYAMLEALVDQHHEDLAHARIALAWNLSWKPDVDGRLQLGKCKKASDLDRELMDFDFVIVLNREFWQERTVEDQQRRALLDHELSHGALKLDKNGEPLEDERGRQVYRIRRHDVEEFTAVVQRHGCYKRDLERFARALRKSKQPSLLDPPGERTTQDIVEEAVENLRPKLGSGVDSITVSSEGRSATLHARKD